MVPFFSFPFQEKSEQRMRSVPSCLLSSLLVIYIVTTGLSWTRIVFLAPSDSNSVLENINSFVDGTKQVAKKRKGRLAQVFTSNATATSQPTAQPAVPLTNRSKFAYAFVIGGCNPEKPSYRYYVYDVLIATRQLRKHGSTADVVVFIQMAWSSNATHLPERESQWMQTMNIRVLYIPKSPKESFYRTCLDKFRILGLIEYDRVLLLDADVLPHANLDYLFDMSVKGILRENLVIRGASEPANAGFFMLQPNKQHLVEINAIIQKRQQDAREMGGPYFDDVVGWGHVFREGDDWQAIRRPSTRLWTFYAAFSDQGLLYYWVKYVRKSVSILVGGNTSSVTVEHWFCDVHGSLVQEVNSIPLQSSLSSLQPGKTWPPGSQYIHYTGDRKPWLPTPGNDRPTGVYAVTRKFWRSELREVARDIGFNVSFPNASDTDNNPALGMGPSKMHIPNADMNLLEREYK